MWNILSRWFLNLIPNQYDKLKTSMGISLDLSWDDSVYNHYIQFKQLCILFDCLFCFSATIVMKKQQYWTNQKSSTLKYDANCKQQQVKDNPNKPTDSSAPSVFTPYVTIATLLVAMFTSLLWVCERHHHLQHKFDFSFPLINMWSSL